MKSFEGKDIIQRILTGHENNLYAVLVEKYELNGSSDTYTVVSSELCFAGTTEQECQEYMEKTAQSLKPWVGEGYILRACVAEAALEDLYEFEIEDIEDGDADEIINEIINTHMQKEILEDVDTDWAFREVQYKYHSLEGCILAYWKWETHVGYARRLLKMEYCVESERTSKECVATDSTSAVQINCLLTPDDIRTCRTSDEMAEMISKQLVILGRWRSTCDVDGFIQELYEDKEKYPSLYSELPPKE